MAVMHDDIDRTKELFRNGLASPYDVSDTRDENLLRVSFASLVVSRYAY